MWIARVRNLMCVGVGVYCNVSFECRMVLLLMTGPIIVMAKTSDDVHFTLQTIPYVLQAFPSPSSDTSTLLILPKSVSVKLVPDIYSSLTVLPSLRLMMVTE